MKLQIRTIISLDDHFSLYWDLSV